MVLVEWWDADTDEVGDGDREGVLTLTVPRGLMVEYLVGSLLVRPFIGRFQYVCSPKPLSVFVRVGMRWCSFVFVLTISVLCSELCLWFKFENVTCRR